MGSQVEFSHTCPAPAADTPLLPPTVLEAAETMAKREKPAAEVIVAADEAEIQQCIQVRIDGTLTRRCSSAIPLTALLYALSLMRRGSSISP